MVLDQLRLFNEDSHGRVDSDELSRPVRQNNEPHDRHDEPQPDDQHQVLDLLLDRLVVVLADEVDDQVHRSDVEMEHSTASNSVMMETAAAVMDVQEAVESKTMIPIPKQETQSILELRHKESSNRSEKVSNRSKHRVSILM